MTQPSADKIIRRLEEFGPQYFRLARATGITAEEYRRIAGSVNDKGLAHLSSAARALVSPGNVQSQARGFSPACIRGIEGNRLKPVRFRYADARDAGSELAAVLNLRTGIAQADIPLARLVCSAAVDLSTILRRCADVMNPRPRLKSTAWALPVNITPNNPTSGRRVDLFAIHDVRQEVATVMRRGPSVLKPQGASLPE